MTEPSFSIVIPAYNEETRISPLLEGLTNPEIEYIFICDGDDNTDFIIRNYAETHDELNIQCYSFPHRLGKGGGVYTGFKKASAPLIGFMDADNSTSVSELIRLCSLIGHHDGIIGSRHLPGQVIHRKQPLYRRIQSRAFNGLIRLMFGLPFHDTQCGAKLFRKEAIYTVLPHLHCRGFEFDVELLWQLKKRGYSLIEVPVIWNDTLDSRLRLSDTIAMLATLLRIRTHTLPHDS
ncbi:dolichyl-phosphate beta-glucosyltransferase [Methanospirillum stamsii]|uniref:dolichyl-phosphate beta-glucosyltransferase n=1 Tax=Methanospirillum stamsii TaxID=1277351 RepID=A0A2V2NHT8_9EURY|nr:dolichyl-phosphate beta-glucosyltransferase [Methanospirillum stamsii]PWR75161.1 glycosyl transferase [Methanospirillum stamsii]